MIASTRRRRELAGEDHGFTLIELAVVILIIGVLLGIAIPTFLAVSSRAKNKASQSALRNSLVTAKTAFSDGGTLVGVFATTLSSIEPSLTFANGGTSTAPGDIRFTIVGNLFTAWSKSASGNCYGIQENLSVSDTVYAVRAGTVTCDGSGFAPWTDKWSSG